MSTQTKKVISNVFWITVLVIDVLAISLIYWYTHSDVKVNAQSTQVTCPVGSYEIGKDDSGNPICKNEPTGCPYGDSIPLDSPKCVAPDPKVWEKWEPEATPASVESTPAPEAVSTTQVSQCGK